MTETKIARQPNRYYRKFNTTNTFGAKAKDQREGGDRIYYQSEKAEGGGYWRHEEDRLYGHIVDARIEDTKFGTQASIAIDHGDHLAYFQTNIKSDNGWITEDFNRLAQRVANIDLDKKVRLTIFQPKEPKSQKDGKDIFAHLLVLFQGRDSVKPTFSLEGEGSDRKLVNSKDGSVVPSAQSYETPSGETKWDGGPTVAYFKDYFAKWVESNKELFEERLKIFYDRFEEEDDDESFVSANANALKTGAAPAPAGSVEVEEEGDEDMPF